MLAPPLVEQVERLLADSVSHRQIARRLHISRGSVNAVAQGRRTICPAPPDDEEDEDDDSLVPGGPLARCGGCGGMVYMPCLLCRVRNWLRPRRQPATRCGKPNGSARLAGGPEPHEACPEPNGGANGFLGLNLTDPQRKRYDEVRAARLLGIPLGSDQRGADRLQGQSEGDRPDDRQSEGSQGQGNQSQGNQSEGNP